MTANLGDDLVGTTPAWAGTNSRSIVITASLQNYFRWRKRPSAEVHHLREGTTPALAGPTRGRGRCCRAPTNDSRLAGPTTLSGRPRPSTWNDSRAGGNNLSPMSYPPYQVEPFPHGGSNVWLEVYLGIATESLPRGREQPRDGRTRVRPQGTTPARAGTTHRWSPVLSWSGNHSRAGGNDRLAGSRTGWGMELLPHVRERLCRGLVGHEQRRTTPARAGTTATRTRMRGGRWNHTRGCGNDSARMPWRRTIQELPQVRERRSPPAVAAADHGTTPAWAGPTRRRRPRSTRRGNDSRAGGTHRAVPARAPQPVERLPHVRE